MYEYDFSKLWLPSKSIRLLKRFARKAQVYLPQYDLLLDCGLVGFINYTQDEIGNQIAIRDVCAITEKGKSYLIYRHTLWVDRRLPIVISVIALIGAFRGELFWLLQAIASLWR